MRIGIVTVHDSNNYGSFLQAYALQVVLQGMGHEVYFAKTRDKKFVKRIFVPALFQRELFKHPFTLFRARKNGRIKRKAFLHDQKIFKEIESVELKEMDLVILGSDEIWNVKVRSFQKRIFYGENLPDVIAYGVSTGRAELVDFQTYPNIIQDIKRIKTILVRDLRTKDIVEKIVDSIPDIVCDPTFLVDSTVLKKQTKVSLLIQKKYVLIYSYGISENLQKKIKKFAEENELKIVSSCFYYDWADFNIMCGPMEFCSLMEAAEYIITTTFHGTIFSILNKKQFICFPASIKTDDLLTRLGLQHRMLDDTVNENIMQCRLKNDKIDYDKVEEKIAAMRKRSLELLEKCIESMVKENGKAV